MQPKTPDQLRDWLRTHEKIAHRDDLLRAGFGIRLIRTFIGSGEAGADPPRVDLPS